MGFLTKFGTQWGQVPVFHGRIFWVAPGASYTVEGRAYSASDDNDGLSPERALLTVNRAWALVTASVGDVIRLLPGTHLQTVVIRANVAGVAMVGEPAGRFGESVAGPRGVRYASQLSMTGTSSALLSIEANNVEVGCVTLIPASGFSAVQFRNANPDNFYLHDFYVDLATPAIAVGTYGIDFGYRADSSTAGGASIAKAGGTTTLATAYLERGTFWSDGAQGRAVDVATAGVSIRDCWFHNSAGAWASPFAVATAADNCLVQDCVWTTAGTMGSCIDGTTADVADGVSIRSNTFPRAGVITSGLVVDNFGTNEAQMVENYQEGSASAVTTIT